MVLINGCTLAYLLNKSDNTLENKVHCIWSDYGQCTKTCGQGFRHRYRKQSAKHNGNECIGDSVEPCYLAKCPDPGIFRITYFHFLTLVNISTIF